MRQEIINSYISTVKNIESGKLVIPLMDAPIYAFSLYKGFDSHLMPRLIDSLDAHCKTNYSTAYLLEQVHSLYANIDDSRPAPAFEQIADLLVPVFDTFDELLSKITNRIVYSVGVNFSDLLELFTSACRFVNNLALHQEAASGYIQMYYGQALGFAVVMRLMNHIVEIEPTPFKDVRVIKAYTIDGIRTELI